ncbi:hypothetical protein CHGG_04648 [Chaetomium globosum CBS 148.51]|uniref:F-box domain-containing protein n=1 Tax=Chaetomium globosum (strain ATCC 6205 / CBS 148.51 / DSM 1962 / NBRC 6347 / NRRL 1970) TaxID=306901 RepID=Q2H0P8_CHAGB|nr:uncharacterized protein CHGG_04648 [Chaetomium globosum CBS 148.51]EAQ88029.1 hypothetical protein CHGG_04648 [Chaetomium globosum CBS 148.51]
MLTQLTATQMTTHLLDCNEDVLRLILDYLSQDDLYKVCLVHPQLRYLAEAPLYSTIELYYDEEKYSSTRHPITSLIRTLLRRPDLATLVRSVSCLPGEHTGEILEAQNIPVCETGLKEALSFVEKTGLPYRDTWMEELRQGNLDAYLAILLSQLPRLRRLYLTHKFSQKTDLITLVLRSMLCDSHPSQPIPGINSTSLHQLQTVSLERFPGHYLTPSSLNTENILPFFYLPSIQILDLPIDDPPTSTLPWPTPQPPSALNLHTLALRHIREAHLAALLTATPHLHTLNWQWRFDPDITTDAANTPTVNLTQLLLALTPLHPTLTTLHIHASCLYTTQPFIPFPLSIHGTMAALAHFAHLRTLTIPLVFVTGFALPLPTHPHHTLAHCLPPSLEVLTLTDDLYVDIDTKEPWDETGHAAAVRDWLALFGGDNDPELLEMVVLMVLVGTGCGVVIPRLRRLGLVMRGEDEEVCEGEREVRSEMGELARRVGVELWVRRGGWEGGE